jgi:protein-S-isoprenylcysteine O-methyltransferase Ste14
MNENPEAKSFSERGGWWVLAQFPLLIIAYLVPLWFGRQVSLAQLDFVSGAGLILLGAGILQSAAGVVALGRVLTPFPCPVDHGELRTSGAYSLVRHPIYSGILFMALGWSLYRFSIPGVVFDVLLFVFFDRKAAREEQWLIERYPAYVAYRHRVRKLIPGIY